MNDKIGAAATLVLVFVCLAIWLYWGYLFLKPTV
jgi:hypothetical protein